MPDPIIQILDRLKTYATEAGDNDASLYCQVQAELRRRANVAYVVRIRGHKGRWLVVEGNPEDPGFGARKIVGEANARKHNNLRYGVEKGGRTWHLNEMQATFGDYEVESVQEFRP
jgi:hypothetical protein